MSDVLVIDGDRPIVQIVGDTATVEGLVGPPGATGDVGATGATGATGAAGAVWRTGSGAPSDGLGINGDYYLNTANSDVYYKSGGTYSVVANIKGATGATGTAGADGSDGQGVVWRGDWSASNTYAVLDIVQYSGSAYICVIAVGPTADTPVVDTAEWDVIAVGGIEGPEGPTGPQGPQGDTGAAGADATPWDFLGDWSDAVNYVPSDVAVYAGELYIATLANTDMPPEQDYPTTVLADTPLGYWRLGEASGNFADSTTGAHTLVATGSITYGVDNTVIPDLVDDGAVTMPTGTYASFASGVAPTAPYTIELWGKCSAGWAGGLRLTATTYPTFNPWHSSTPAKALIYLNGSNYRYGSTSTADGNWHHFVFVVTGTAAADILTSKIYVDGILETAGSTVSTDTPVAPTGAVYLVGSSTNPSYDEVAIYDYELDAARVLEHFEVGTTTLWSKITQKGTDGSPGVGVPAGGTDGQVLIKSGGTDYVTTWNDFAPAAVNVPLTDAGGYFATNNVEAALQEIGAGGIGGGGGSGNLDGGNPASTYGGTTAINGGTP
jgi:hypothetical protein